MSGALQGRTALVTGASRGIGRAIAVALAGAGASVVLCARTIEAHPTLDGSLLATEATISSVGGKALVAPFDIRDEEAIAAAVAAGVDAFGGLDIVVCNAGALFIAPFEAAPIKRFDLVHQINVRGTYALCHAALPHLQASEDGRILTISPPIDLDPKWLVGTLAYTISKYSMSMVVAGLAAELAPHSITANALWPATTIDTAAVRHNPALGGEEMASRSRHPSIVADAALLMLTDANRATGRFVTDEQVLAEAGITDLDGYAVDPSKPLQPDFYL